jgi:hypothetical protein
MYNKYIDCFDAFILIAIVHAVCTKESYCLRIKWIKMFEILLILLSYHRVYAVINIVRRVSLHSLVSAAWIS